MKKIVIEKVTENHLKDINELSYTVFKLHDKLIPNFFADRDVNVSMKRYQELKDKDNVVFLVAVKEKLVIGYLLALISDKPWQKTTPVRNLEEIGVLDSFQHQRIGETLFTALKKECKKRNIHNITLNVYSKNTKAIKFYKKMGCHITSQRMDMEIK